MARKIAHVSNANLVPSDDCVAILINREGFEAKAYWDPTGKLWTIGYGHTRTAKKGMVITKAQAFELKRQDMALFASCVLENVPVKLTQWQFDALVSFAFNFGCGGFKKTDVYKKLVKGDYAGASASFTKYNKSGGRVLGGLTKRRTMEKQLFDTGDVTLLADNVATDQALDVSNSAVSPTMQKTIAYLTVATLGSSLAWNGYQLLSRTRKSRR